MIPRRLPRRDKRPAQPSRPPFRSDVGGSLPRHQFKKTPLLSSRAFIPGAHELQVPTFFRRVILFAPSAPVEIFILTMRAFDRSRLMIYRRCLLPVLGFIARQANNLDSKALTKTTAIVVN